MKKKKTKMMNRRHRKAKVNYETRATTGEAVAVRDGTGPGVTTGAGPRSGTSDRPAGRGRAIIYIAECEEEARLIGARVLALLQTGVTIRKGPDGCCAVVVDCEIPDFDGEASNAMLDQFATFTVCELLLKKLFLSNDDPVQTEPIT